MGMQTAWKQGNSCSTSHFLVASCVAHVGLELLFVVAPLLLAHEASPTWRRVTGISATSGRHGPTGPTKNRWGLGNQIFVGLKLEMPQETVGQIINVSLNFGKVETLKLRSLTWVSRWGTFNNQIQWFNAVWINYQRECLLRWFFEIGHVSHAKCANPQLKVHCWAWPPTVCWESSNQSREVLCFGRFSFAFISPLQTANHCFETFWSFWQIPVTVNDFR